MRATFTSLLRFFAVFLAEYRRATAAARRYEELKRTHRSTPAGEDGASHPNIPRRVFEEYYRCTDDVSGHIPGRAEYHIVSQFVR
jgi:hypothetical protein